MSRGIAKRQSRRTAGRQSFKTENCKVAELQDGRVSKPPNCKTAENKFAKVKNENENSYGCGEGEMNRGIAKL